MKSFTLVTIMMVTVTGNPVFVPLKSQYPENPIEDPQTWAWGLHPDDGLDYKARDNLEVEVCLANPDMINTAKCSLPLDVCLANPQYLSSLGCSGNQYSLETCLAYPEILATPGCAANLTPSMCAATPSITMIPLCLDALDGYQPTLFECQDNKEQLCSLNLCEKHEFIVKCNGK